MIRQLFFIYCIFNINVLNLKAQQQEIPSDTGEFIISHGYKNETHTVRTEDGYHLTLHRITGKQNDTQNNGSKPVVLIGHGIFGSSAMFVLTGPEKGLGYILSDEGYDVWLANFRGTKYSQIHDIHSTSSKEFWNYSWHEMGKFDLPAMMKYILYKTKVDKIFYIGYSQGTTAYFVFSSLHSEFANKHLHAAVALAPVVHLKNVQIDPLIKEASLMTTNFLEFTSFLETSLNVFPVFPVFGDASLVYNMTYNREAVEIIMNFFCNDNQLLDPLCRMLLMLVDGFDEKQTNEALLPIIYKHIPDGTSLKHLMHYAQISKSGKFEMFDDGLKSWFLFWNKDLNYNLSKCNVNVSLFYSKSDWISTADGVKQLSEDLSTEEVFEVEYENFRHIDFVFANDAKILLYNNVLSYMQRFL